jgi:hypothetical protein
MKDCTSFLVVSVGQSTTPIIFGLISTLLSDMMMPKYLILVCSNLHFSSYRYSLCLPLWSKTSHIMHQCSSSELVKIRMSSRYTDTTLSVMRSWNILFIMVWKVVGLLVRPNYMTSGSKRPQFVWNTAFHSLPSQIWTSLYPQHTSSLVK